MATASALGLVRGGKGVPAVKTRQGTYQRYAITPTGLQRGEHCYCTSQTFQSAQALPALQGAHQSPKGPPYQMSVTLETGVWLTISGPTNSGVPYLQYCGSSDVSSCALPKSQILICSLLKSAIRRFSGYRTVQSRGELGRRQGLSPRNACSLSAGALPSQRTGSPAREALGRRSP